MTTNQIAYQKAIAEAQERYENARGKKIENDLQELRNAAEAEYYYGIEPTSDKLQTASNVHAIWEHANNGMKTIERLFGLVKPLSSVVGKSK